MVRVNERFSTLAADEFRLKYSHLQLIIRDDFKLPSNQNELLNVAGMQVDSKTIERNKDMNDETPKISQTQLELENGNQILRTFKYFGHLMKRLKLNLVSLIRPVQVELIGKLISKYSSESLVDIEIEHYAKKLLEHIAKPLINVEIVTFRQIHVMNFNPQSIPFNELFPAVRRLNLDSIIVDDLSYFDYHMTRLEHVSMESIQSPFPGVIMKNPQIQSIDLYQPDDELVQKVNDFLPQLKTLKLSGFKLSNGSIQFSNVTTFIIDYGHYTTPANLHFPQLQTFHFEYDKCQFDDYLDFFNEHNHLSQLHLTMFKLDDSHFQQLTANLTHLIELTLEYGKNSHQYRTLSSNIVVEFVKSHDKVNQLNVINFTKYCEAELQEQLNGEWNTRINGDGLTFQRRIISRSYIR